jgi:hypothetical protein
MEGVAEAAVLIPSYIRAASQDPYFERQRQHERRSGHGGQMMTQEAC